MLYTPTLYAMNSMHTTFTEGKQVFKTLRFFIYIYISQHFLIRDLQLIKRMSCPKMLTQLHVKKQMVCVTVI